VSGWDDDCPGLVGTLAREEEWRIHKPHNNAEAAHWEVAPANDWGNTPPVSLIPKGLGEWPSQEALINAEVAAWPHFLLPILAIEVTIETRSSVGDLFEKHPACRLTAFIDCFSALNLLSFL
jgi:hypothetical protein